MLTIKLKLCSGIEHVSAGISPTLPMRAKTGLLFNYQLKGRKSLWRIQLYDIKAIHWFLLPSHQSQPAVMRDDARPERRVFSVLYTVFGACLFHDPCDCRVMYVADSGEEMVLKVKVQSTKRPAQQ